ncbi:hypothetical protein DL768_001115 [Monosporascus sp. mg162]|nr:hypothetical protein DL768_001115 [Monosporascus sp. mg162]
MFYFTKSLTVPVAYPGARDSIFILLRVFVSPATEQDQRGNERVRSSVSQDEANILKVFSLLFLISQPPDFLQDKKYESPEKYLPDLDLALRAVAGAPEVKPGVERETGASMETNSTAVTEIGAEPGSKPDFGVVHKPGNGDVSVKEEKACIIKGITQQPYIVQPGYELAITLCSALVGYPGGELRSPVWTTFFPGLCKDSDDMNVKACENAGSVMPWMIFDKARKLLSAVCGRILKSPDLGDVGLYRFLYSMLVFMRYLASNPHLLDRFDNEFHVELMAPILNCLLQKYQEKGGENWARICRNVFPEKYTLAKVPPECSMYRTGVKVPEYSHPLPEDWGMRGCAWASEAAPQPVKPLVEMPYQRTRTYILRNEPEPDFAFSTTRSTVGGPTSSDNAASGGATNDYAVGDLVNNGAAKDDAPETRYGEDDFCFIHRKHVRSADQQDAELKEAAPNSRDSSAESVNSAAYYPAGWFSNSRKDFEDRNFEDTRFESDDTILERGVRLLWLTRVLAQKHEAFFIWDFDGDSWRVSERGLQGMQVKSIRTRRDDELKPEEYISSAFELEILLIRSDKVMHDHYSTDPPPEGASQDPPTTPYANVDPELGQYVKRIETLNNDVRMFEFTQKVTNVGLNRIMALGWCVITTWIKPDYVDSKSYMCVSDVSFRFGKGDIRLIVTVDVHLPDHESVLLNIDSDEPGSVVGFVPSMSNELWKLRAVAMIGYGRCSNGRPGLCKPMKLPDLKIAGLDIEVTTHTRNGAMPLPHDRIISITISNGCWYDERGEDVCVCIYTFGHVRQLELGDGRKPVFIKARSSEHAVHLAWAVLDKLGYDFVNIHNAFKFDLRHMAACSAGLDEIGRLFEERRLGNFGFGSFIKLTRGCMFVGSLYTAMKTSKPGQWSSFGLAHMANKLGLPEKLDVDGMMIEARDDYDMTDMLTYNCRDSDLHAWVAKELTMCERLTMFASVDKSCIHDAIANVGMMVFCVQQSCSIPFLASTRASIMIDGNSLYGIIMSELGIFVDRCASSSTVQGLSHRMPVGDLLVNDRSLVMKTRDMYLGIVRGPTILSTIKKFIDERKIAKANGDEELAHAYKMSTTVTFGATSSAQGALSSKTCGEIITYIARHYLRRMIEITTQRGYNVIYGDTDSIFVYVGGTSESECNAAALRIKSAISRQMKGIVFERIGADVKGNYRSIVISSKKKYEGVLWNGDLDTKGLAPIKKDTLPIVRFVMKKVCLPLTPARVRRP